MTASPPIAAGLARLREKALANPVFVGNLVSADGQAAVILRLTETAARDKAFNARFSTQVDDVVARESRSGLTIYQIGGPLIKRTVGEYVERDQLTLIPFSVITLFVRAADRLSDAARRDRAALHGRLERVLGRRPDGVFPHPDERRDGRGAVPRFGRRICGSGAHHLGVPPVPACGTRRFPR